MNIDQLIYFVETARHEHIRKASKILGISPSAISHSISSLEGELRVKLFQKQGKNIVLTKEGQKLLDRSESLITSFQNLKSELLEETNEKSHFRIGAAHLTSTKILTPAWAHLAESFPNTSTELLTFRSAQVLKKVQQKKLDLGLLFSPHAHPDIESRIVKQGYLHIVVNDQHPLLQLNQKDRLKKISDFPAILPKADEGIELCVKHPIFEKYNINPKIKTVTDSYSISFELISTTQHWGLIPDFLLNLTPHKLAILNPKENWDAYFNLSLIWHKKQFIPQFYLELENELKKTLEKL